MFTTFECGSSHSAERPGVGSPASTTPSMPARSRRSQVSRACEWCRAHRIKCDDNQPCHNCQSRGGECSNRRPSETRTMPNAVRQIERLKLRNKELEERVESQARTIRELSNGKSPLNSEVSTVGSHPDPLKEHGCNKKHSDGIFTSTAQSRQTQYYGPLSNLYFIGRINSHLSTAFQQPHPDHQMQPNSASKAFASPTSPTEEGTPEMPAQNGNLTRSQEDFFLGLFWQSYHCTLQVIDEAEFREHYESLWTTSATTRKASALVDILLAMCMQYGSAFIPRGEMILGSTGYVDKDDATIAGRWFYRRCQTLLAHEVESPSISTVQCHIFSVIYLCNASFQNMAHSALALAVRTAHILGLHLEPPEDMPRPRKDLRRRVWWTLYALELKTCMKLGRPWSVNLSEVTCTLPSDDRECALISGSKFTSSAENMTWLSYGLQHVHLLLAVCKVYTLFSNRYTDVMNANGGKGLYNDPQVFESCAEFLMSSMKCLRNWLHDVPDALKTKRKGTGEPFSIDRSPLDVDRFAPLWLQRQRLCLELLYHNLSMNLHRPFICFNFAPAACTPLAEGNAIACLNHAMAITSILHQILTETDILSGWHEAFQWQWNATLTMIGFILAYPMNPSSPPARKTINSAIAVFESFGNNFAIAASAAVLTRNLTAKADFLIDRFRATVLGHTIPGGDDVLQSNDFHSNDGNGGSGVMESLPANFTSLAFDLDSFNNFDSFESDMVDTWTFPQESGSQLPSSWLANS